MSRRAILSFAAGFLFAAILGWVGLPALLYARSAQPAAFNHRLHTSDQVGLTCEDCHAILEDGRFSGIPPLARCASCHAEPLGESAAEKRLVEEYVRPGREIPWLVYARQPDNVRFSHARHVRQARIACERCHGPHGTSQSLPPYQKDRISGYSRGNWGPSRARVQLGLGEGMRMGDCEGCHASRGRTSCLACHR